MSRRLKVITEGKLKDNTHPSAVELDEKGGLESVDLLFNKMFRVEEVAVELEVVEFRSWGKFIATVSLSGYRKSRSIPSSTPRCGLTIN